MEDFSAAVESAEVTNAMREPEEGDEEGGEAGFDLGVVRFLLKNLHFLLKNLHFLLKTVDFLLKTVDFMRKGGGAEGVGPRGAAQRQAGEGAPRG